VEGDVAALCGLAATPQANAVRERFALLGERWIAARDLGQHQQALAASEAEVTRISGDYANARGWAENAQAEVGRLFSELGQAREAHRGTRANLAQARYEVAARDERIMGCEGRIAALEAVIAGKDEVVAQRDAALRAQADREAAVWAVADRLGRELAWAQAQIHALERERAVVLSSTSWRLTAPMRQLLRAARRQASAEPARLIALPAPEWMPPPPVPRLAPAIADASAAPAIGQDVAGPRALFISGEDHTPGTVYRVERYAATARALGYEARAMPAAPVGPQDLKGASLVVLWRVPFSAHIQGIITVAHEEGATVVFDVDDLMFRPELARVEIIDGIRSQRFSEVETQAFFKLIAKTLRACDMVTCPTLELAHQVHKMGRAAAVLPNGFDQDSHDVARRARAEWLSYADELVRIGYASGSRTHQRDFAVAVPALLRVLRENPQVRLTLFRDGSSGEGLVLIDEFPELGAFAERIEWRDLVKLADLPKEMARFEISIAPLEADNPFCEAKSELKFFEAALAGVPTVASPSGPFARAIRDGVSGFLAGDDEGWYAALTRLVRDQDLRRRMAQAAYHVSLACFGPEARAEAFELAVAQMQGGEAGAAAFERAAYRAALPAVDPPHVPASEVLFRRDRGQDAAVTVILPVFRYADYLGEALASVAAQSLSAIDLVVVDDASPDDSVEMARDWMARNEARFNRVTLVRHQVNSGLGFARNSGFAAAETQFVLPLDADNRLRPNCCEVLWRRLSAGRAAFAYPAIQQFGTKSEIFGTEAFSSLRLQTGNYIDAMALVRKSAWALAGGYDHIASGWEDFDFWCRLVERGAFGLSVPEVLADYRVHGDSMLHRVTDKSDIRAALVRDLARRHPWLDLAG
jgi:glycosyltransferase involved in cell wall biosynthesis